MTKGPEKKQRIPDKTSLQAGFHGQLTAAHFERLDRGMSEEKSMKIMARQERTGARLVGLVVTPQKKTRPRPRPSRPPRPTRKPKEEPRKIKGEKNANQLPHSKD